MGRERFIATQAFPTLIATKVLLAAVLLVQPKPCLGNPLKISRSSIDLPGSGVYTVQVHQAFIVPFCLI